jgi:hypothetical protein
VSTVIRPVTHTADVAKNKAVTRSSRSPFATAIGNDSRTSPGVRTRRARRLRAKWFMKRTLGYMGS